MTGTMSSRNTVQKGQIDVASTMSGINVISTSAATATFYTCPDGKTARISGLTYCYGFGGSGSASLQIAGNNVIVFRSEDFYVPTYFDAFLTAGQTIYKQQSGTSTNAEVVVTATVWEYDA